MAEEGKREVWYQLTPVGRELAPVISGLNAWGLRHAMRPLEPGETVRPGALVRSFNAYLISERIQLSRATAWQLNFGADAEFVVTFDGRRWSYTRGQTDADVTVETTPEAWASMLSERRLKPAVAIAGNPDAVAEFRAILGNLLGSSVPAS